MFLASWPLSHVSPHISRVGRAKRLRAASSALLLLWLGLQPARAAEPGANPSKLLTTVLQVHRVTTQEAETHRPVRLRGVVTVLSSYPNAFFFQDRTGGISIEASGPTGAYNGAEVEVSGYTAPGMFAPLIKVLEVRVLGRGTLPRAPLFTYSQLTGGSQDSNWITIRGVVRSAKLDTLWSQQVLILQIESDGGFINAQLYQFQPGDADKLVDAKVRVTGVCTTGFNDKRQFTGIGLLMAGIQNVKIDEPGPADPFSIPLVPVRNLLQFKPGARQGHRVRVAGVVTYQDPGHTLYVQDGTDGVLVQSDQETRVPLGTRLDVVGFPVSGAYSPVLSAAVFRSVGSAKPVVPALIHANDFLHKTKFITVPYDGQLVSLEGKLLELTTRLNDDAWFLRDGTSHVVAILRHSSEPIKLPSIENGSIVRVTGVFSVQVDENRQPTSFRVLLRTPADLIVVQRASWWTTTHALIVLSAVLVATFAIALWGILLRRTVRNQTQMLRESGERFRKQAQRDALTGLASRSYLHEQLHEAIHQAMATRQKMGLLMVDLDHFKQVNDTLGHHAGDELLCVVAARIRASVREADIVARMGGDEFVVLLKDVKGPTEARAIGAKVVANVANPAQIAGRSMQISGSVGVCLYPDDASSPDELFQNVDAAMYQAKAAGRNSFSLYRSADTSIHQGASPVLAGAGV